MRSYVKVRFDGHTKRTYTYTAKGSVEELKHNTHAVVMSPSSGLVVVVVDDVSRLDESTYDGTYKNVVLMFNLDEYNKELDKQTRKAALEKELRNRVAQRKLEDNFAKLLEGDEDSMKLLEEYKKL